MVRQRAPKRRLRVWLLVASLLALATATPEAARAQDEEQEIIENEVYLAEGRALELRSYEDYPGRARDVHTEMHQPQVTIRDDVAWITYYWTDSGRIGEERFTSRGKSTRIFVREGGRWLCIHGHYTAVP